MSIDFLNKVHSNLEKHGFTVNRKFDLFMFNLGFRSFFAETKSHTCFFTIKNNKDEYLILNKLTTFTT